MKTLITLLLLIPTLGIAQVEETVHIENRKQSELESPYVNLAFSESMPHELKGISVYGLFTRVKMVCSSSNFLWVVESVEIICGGTPAEYGQLFQEDGNLGALRSIDLESNSIDNYQFTNPGKFFANYSSAMWNQFVVR